MTSLLVPEMLRRGFDPLREAMEHEEKPPTRRWRRSVLSALPLIFAMLERVRGWTGQLTDQGIEARTLAVVLNETLQALNFGRDTLLELRKTWASAPLDDGKEDDLKTLDGFVTKLEALQDETRSFLRWLDKPLPPIDLAAIERAKSGKAEDSDSILARLRAGGNL
jgi:hypothetical protein